MTDPKKAPLRAALQYLAVDDGGEAVYHASQAGGIAAEHDGRYDHREVVIRDGREGGGDQRFQFGERLGAQHAQPHIGGGIVAAVKVQEGFPGVDAFGGERALDRRQVDHRRLLLRGHRREVMDAAVLASVGRLPHRAKVVIFVIKFSHEYFVFF